VGQAQSARIRGQIPYVDPANDEIDDPATPEALWHCAENIDRAVRTTISALCGDAGPPAGHRE
jgi:hypothetical protein